MALTKEDLAQIKKLLDVQDIRADLKIEESEKRIISSFEKFRSDFHNEISPILKEVQDNRLERIVMVNNIENHDQRIDKLEHKAGII